MAKMHNKKWLVIALIIACFFSIQIYKNSKIGICLETFLQLDKREQKLVVNPWLGNTVSSVVLDEKRVSVIDEHYIGVEVYCVNFKTKDILEELLIFLDKNTHKIIAKGIRE